MGIMNYLIGIIKAAFGASPLCLDAVAMRARDEARIKAICSSLARGNISLINGKFLTTKELEIRRSANLAHKFN
jgi:hypothetical protein